VGVGGDFNQCTLIKSLPIYSLSTNTSTSYVKATCAGPQTNAMVQLFRYTAKPSISNADHILFTRVDVTVGSYLQMPSEAITLARH